MGQLSKVNTENEDQSKTRWNNHELGYQLGYFGIRMVRDIVGKGQLISKQNCRANLVSRLTDL